MNLPLAYIAPRQLLLIDFQSTIIIQNFNEISTLIYYVQ